MQYPRLQRRKARGRRVHRLQKKAGAGPRSRGGLGGLWLSRAPGAVGGVGQKSRLPVPPPPAPASLGEIQSSLLEPVSPTPPSSVCPDTFTTRP